MILLALVLIFGQQAPARPRSLPPLVQIPPVTKGEERTVFYDTKHNHCAVLAERKVLGEQWSVYFDDKNLGYRTSPAFHSRQEAYDVAALQCRGGTK